MRLRLSALVWLIASLLACMGVFVSQSPAIWVLTAMTLPLAIAVAGRIGEKPIVVAHFGLFWLAVFGGLLTRDIRGQSIDDYPYERLAILLSLGALIALAAGYRAGWSVLPDRPARDVSLNRRKLLASYFVMFATSSALEYLARLVPELTQPLLALNGIRLLLLYLLCAQVFQDRAGYGWVALVVAAELVIGAVGYIASYHVPLLVVFAATLNSRRGGLGVGQVAAGALVFALLLWASFVWTAVKPEYRAWLEFGPPSETSSTSDRLNWISNYVSGGIDYSVASTRFVERIGYTELYSNALPRFGNVDTSFWLDAVGKVLTPRILFPDKAILDDTRITSELTGRQFGKNTSVSIGYVAQAQADFGAPAMFIPIFLVGLAMGATGRYFHTRPCSQIARDGFLTAALVFRFTYEQNIDKALGGFVILTLVMMLVFRFAYQPFEKWLSASPRAAVRGRASPIYGQRRI